MRGAQDQVLVRQLHLAAVFFALSQRFLDSLGGPQLPAREKSRQTLKQARAPSRRRVGGFVGRLNHNGVCRTPLAASGVGIFYSQRSQDGALARFHGFGVGRLFVIIAYQMEKAVNDQMCGMVFEPLSLKIRFLDNGFRRQRNVAEEPGFGLGARHRRE